MKHLLPSILLIGFAICFTFCLGTKKNKAMLSKKKDKGIILVHLASNDTDGLAKIRTAFKKNNPGYDLNYYANTKIIKAASQNQVVFIQVGGGTASINSGEKSKFSVGDIIMLDKGESIETDSLFSSLVFTVPHTPPANVPSFIRPDWDMNITDTPGGCATETNAYRRILLTWKDKVGPYLFHAINAHRVRIMDSFSHYHPVRGGFDEFYLVQMVQKNARLITSNQVMTIENPLAVTKEQSKNLVQSTPLKTGDLIYMPRGVMHRGLGGVLAQVITVPGFIPMSEIGVDHHLRKINENLKLKGAAQLPYNEAASTTAIIK